MPAYFQLQDLKTLSETLGKSIDVAQDLECAAEVLPYRRIVLQLRVPFLASTAGTNWMYVEHAPILKDDAFSTFGVFDLEGGPNQWGFAYNPLRYIRWRASLSAVGGVAKSVRFTLDVVAREV